MKKNVGSHLVNIRQQPFLFLCIELFFIVFSIHINGFNGLFTLRNLTMGLVICLSISFFRSNAFLNYYTRKIDSRWVYSMIVFFIYSVALVLLNNAPLGDAHNVVRSTFGFLIMVVIIPFFLLKMEHKTNRFAMAMTIVTTIQSLIVIGCFLSSAFKMYIFSIQEWEDDFLFYRVSGLGIAGAGGTVYLFCGFLANCYYLLFYKRQIIYFITLIIILFSTMLVGRTGFYMEVVMLLYIVWKFSEVSSAKGGLMYTMITVFVSVFVVVAAMWYVQSNAEVDYDMLDSSYNRLGDIVEGRTVDAIQNMRIPDINVMTLLFGTGMTKGPSFDGTIIWNDSGYVQRFHGFGLIPAFLSYLILFLYMWSLLKRNNNKDKRKFWMIPIIMMFIIDYKEAFVFYFALPFVLIMFLKLELYEQKANQLDAVHRISK